MGSTECFLKPVKDSLLRLIAEGSILIAYFKGGQISCISKSQSLWTRTWPWAFSYFICSTAQWIQLFILVYLPTGHKNDRDAGTSHAFVSWKTQPKMPRDDSIQMNPCCGQWGPLIGEGGGEIIDFSLRTLVFSLPGESLSTIQLSILLHREYPAWKIRSNWWEAHKNVPTLAGSHRSELLTMRELRVLQRHEEKAAAFLGGGVRQNVSRLGFEWKASGTIKQWPYSVLSGWRVILGKVDIWWRGPSLEGEPN